MTERGVPVAVVAAKLARPHIDHVLVRDDALAGFAQASRRRLTLIRAPAGYGKTTLAAEALERLGLEAIWYTLDVLDHDPVVFLASLAEALRQRFPDFGDVIRERLRAANEVRFPLQEMAAIFINDVERCVGREVHLVFDDYHEAADSGALNMVLDYLFANAPTGVRFIVLSRYDPAFATAKMRLAGEVGQIGVDLLRFDARQAAAVLSAHTGRRHQARHVARLVDLTEGWPASIVLAALAVQDRDLDRLEDALADPRLKQDIYSFLAEQVYSREDEATRHFLRRTCCLEHVTCELADRLTGNSDAHLLLHRLARNRVFTFTTEEPGSYRYHNLFRDYLKQRCVIERGNQAFKDLQCETATVVEEAGELEMTVELLLSANEPGRALEAIARAGEAGLDSLTTDIQNAWLARLHASLAADHPWVLLLRAHALLRQGDYEAALAELQVAHRTFAAQADAWGEYQSLSLMETTQFWKGDLDSAVRTCRRALSCAPSPAHTVHTLLSMASAACDLRDWPEALEAFTAAEALGDAASPVERIRARMLRALALFNQGQFRTALDALPAFGEPLLPMTLRVALLNTRGYMLTGLVDYTAAEQTLAHARQLAITYGVDTIAAHVTDNLGMLRCAQGRFDESLTLFGEVLSRGAADGEPTLHALALCHSGTCHRRQNQLAQAEHWYEQAVAAADPQRDPYLAWNCRADLLFTQGLGGLDAIAELDALTATAAAGAARFVGLKAELFAAVLLVVAEDEVSAGERLAGCIPQQLELGHLCLLTQELCQHDSVLQLLARSEALAGGLPDILALVCSHWDAAEVLRRLVEAMPGLAADCISAAGAHAPPGVLLRLIEGTSHLRSPEVTEARQRAAARSEGRVARQAPGDTRLTRREHEVLGLVAAGQTNPQIAEQLFLSPATVKTHINRIFRKLGVNNRIQAVIKFEEGRSIEAGE